MAYDPTVWKMGDVVSSYKLNKLENGLAGSYDEIARLDGDIDGLADDLDTEVAALRSQIGSPLVANTAEEMTNINKVYVYTGSETGYTAGHWYYFDGTEWADGGVYNSVAVQTDKTLTVPDMPADAKVTGDEIGALKEDLTTFIDQEFEFSFEELPDPFESGTIETGVAVGTVIDFTRNSSNTFTSALVICRKNDVFKVTGTGGDGPRLWAFCDENHVLISKSAGYVEATNLELTAPSDGYLIVGVGINADKQILKKQYEVIIPQKYLDILDDLSSEEWVDITNFEDGTIKTNVAVRTIIDFTRTASNTFESALVPCKKDDGFKITGKGGDAARLWAFCDENQVLISKAAGYAEGTNLELTAPADGYLIVGAGKNFDKQILKKQLEVIIPQKYSDILDNFADSVSKVAEVGRNWSSDIIPDHGTTTQYSAISEFNPTLTELYALYDSLVTAYPNYISKTDLGVDQSGLYHIYKYSFVPETISLEGVGNFNLPNFPKILLGSGTHGNGQDAGDEPEMVVGVYHFIKNICENWYGNDALTYLRHHVQIELIPVQNPWGYVNLSRRNSRGVDINRNFPFGWTQGTEGSTTYGGTSPFSEAESVIIRDFVESNPDSLFYLDLHATGGTQTQAHMIYYSMNQYSNLIVPANDTVVYLSDKWNHENIANLDTSIMHGYINRTSKNGSGSIYQWVCAVKGIPACVMEAFPNFEDSGLEDNSELVMRMCQEELVTFIIKSIRYIKFNYLSNQR